MRWFRRMPVLHIGEERGEGPTVLLLHGIASSSVTFHHVIPLLERTHRCIAIDLLGFGAVAVPPEHAGLFRPDGRLFGAWLDAERLATAVA